MARSYVSSQAFVAGYLFGHKQGWNMQQVADHLGMVKASATVKASQLRQMGIELPKLKQSRTKMDLGVLARMVSDYEASMIDMDGKENVTISDHLDPDIPDDDLGDLDPDVPNDDFGDSDTDDQNDGRSLVGSM